MCKVIYIFMLLTASFAAAGDFNEGQKEDEDHYVLNSEVLSDIIDNSNSDNFTSWMNWAAKNCLGGICKAVAVASQFASASAQAPTPDCRDTYEQDKSECLEHCCGWCGSIPLCMDGNMNGPIDGSYGLCPDLQTWNWTGQGCHNITNTQGWLLVTGIVAVPIIFYGSYKLYTYYCWKKRQYEPIQ